MKFHRTLAALIPALCLLAVPPAEAVERDAYALTHPDGAQGVTYVTPFALRHTVPGRDGSGGFSGSETPRIYRLTGEDGQEIDAYCIDAAGQVTEGARYRRMNLEDSTMFSNAAAGRLRAISANSFPRKRISDLEESANLWLTEMGLPQIQGLQSGEAILAAQIAIWKLTQGPGYSVNSLYCGRVDVAEDETTVRYTEELRQPETENTRSNIEGLYTYFCNLAPMGPADRLVGDTSITRTVYTCTQDPDGKISATVSVTIQASLKEGDSLILSATCEDQTREQPVMEAGEYTFSFTGLSQRSAVKLALRGMQQGADVYLFAAKGDPASGTLLGYDDSVLPVYCERILTPVPANP